MSHFLLGFAIGAAIGAAAVIISAPRSGTATRRRIGDTINATIDAARHATAAREQELWAEFRARLPKENAGTGDQERS